MDSTMIPAGASGDLKTALAAAEAGVSAIRAKLPQFASDKSNFSRQQPARQKDGSRGLVTETDLAAETAILAVLAANSNYGVLSEESGEQISDSELRWIVDPLDGTSNFARGIPQFAVSIALARGSELLIGVISDPVTGDCFFAERGKGAFCNAERLTVSSNVDPARAMIVVNHGYRPEDRILYAKAVSKFMLESYMRKLGSTAMELAYVARGHLDVWICSGDELWDFAGGLVIVQEAGGKVTDWSGRPWDGSTRDIVVTNSVLHDYTIERLSGLLI